MPRPACLALLAVLLVLPLAAALPGAALEVEQKGSLSAVVDRTAHAPGSTARLAAVLEIEDGWHVNAHEPSFDFLIPTELTVTLPAGWGGATLAYPEAVSRTFAFAGEPLAVYEGRVVMLAALEVPAGAAAGAHPVAAAVRYQACDDDSCLPPVTAEAAVELVVGPGGEARHEALFAAGPVQGGGGHGEDDEGRTAGGADGGAASGGATSSGADSGGLGAGRIALMLLFGLVGGVILNVMPCVLPVLSLKVFGLVQSAGIGRREVVVGSLATTAGILASFWALALFAIGARAAGAAVGWGVQFQQPVFVTFLAVVVVLFCLNLWGLFEIQLPFGLANRLGGGPQEGVAGHFASGLFATLMATPCSAPFLGTAVGFALAQSSPVILAVFTAVGLGMALPYLALAVAPGAARLLPKPGAWMEHARRLMGFLLAAAAVWLFYVLAGQISAERLAAIELGLLALALFVWMRHRAGGGAVLRGAAAAGMAAAVVAALLLAGGADARAERPSPAAGGEARIPWVEFDRARAEALAAEGRLVFVDVTADWCFTCKANERLVLETPETRALFAEHGVVAMKADWTNRDDDIAAFLAEHGKYSIPFYLLYRPGEAPHPFSELLTKSNLRQAVEASSPTQTAGLD
jgi:thiol:disulfide interchange protein